MKSLHNYIVKESGMGDLFIVVADSIKDPKHLTDNDIKSIIKNVQKSFGFELPENEAKSLANTVINDFPDMFNT